MSELARLESLALSYADLTSNDSGQGGLDFLQRLPGLVSLRIGRCMIDTRCLRGLSKQEQLRELTLHQNSVEPDSLRELGKFQHLETLTVVDSELTDADVALFTGLTGLKSLNINRNAFSPDGIAMLRKSLPGCRIESDHGTFEPAATPDRRAAEWSLKHGGSVVVQFGDGDSGQRISAGEPLPDRPFQLVQINLSKPAPEDEFVNLSGLTSLKAAHLNYFPLTNAALAHLKDSHQLNVLHVEGTQVTDEGLQVLDSFPDLRNLWLPGRFTDTAFAQITKHKQLTQLGVGFKSATNSGFGRLADLTRLKELSLYFLDFTSVELNATAIRTLQKHPDLTALSFSRCQFNRECLQELAGLKQVRDLTFGDRDIDPRLLGDPNRFSHLTSLSFIGTGLTDNGIESLRGLTSLKSLNIVRNSITPNGVEALRKSLPGCRIESDHGTFEATTPADNAQD